MGDPGSLGSALTGAHGVYSVQTPYAAGPEAEVRHGKNVADAARDAGVRHIVYGSAGFGKPGTGVPSWETKVEVEEHMRRLGLPLTVLRPTAFMELMTDRGFYPALTTWHVMPTVMGGARRLPWLCTDDLGAIAAKVFAEPDQFVGRDLNLASDEKSLDECRQIYRAVMGRNPPRFPIPTWLFARFGIVGQDLIAMWGWLRTGTFDADVQATRAILPGALTVEEWLRRSRA
jgi:uncharacterized protein YbjT (DUF2867 family)